jgi:hypothetical protein
MQFTIRCTVIGDSFERAAINCLLRDIEMPHINTVMVALFASPEQAALVLYSFAYMDPTLTSCGNHTIPLRSIHRCIPVRCALVSFYKGRCSEVLMHVSFQ